MLGRLQKIELRDIWRTEDQDFTPWLAREDNITLLGDTLGLELEVEAQEKEVGPFRADILCKDLTDGTWVLIENQLERTDHKHLGQLLTYAAGLQAVTIVWVAAQFTDEHRAALDWLNTGTDDGFRFFALEVELWKIGDSAAAPKFNVVSQPNEWSKTVGAATRRISREALTDTKKLQLDYWLGLHEKILATTAIKSRKPRAQHWTNYSIGRSGMKLGAVLNSRDQRISVEFYLYDEHAADYFSQLEEQRDDIEQALGFGVTWMPLPTKQACRIICHKDNCPLDALTRWDEYQTWMIAKLEIFDKVFRPRVKRLDVSDLVLEQAKEISQT